MKIVISGGHLTPALAVIDYILQDEKRSEKNMIIFFGREFSQDKLKQKALEAEEIAKRTKIYTDKKIKYIPFFSARFVNSSLAESLQGISILLKSLKIANKIITDEKPDIFLSFGGYLAVPIAFICWIKRIPIVTHEQTRVAGMANKVLGLLATKIAITFESSSEEFSQDKVVLTGNPVRSQIFKAGSPRPDWLSTKIEKPILLVMGGNQGSKAINKVIAENLEKIAEQWTVIHQCGRQNLEDNYLSQLENLGQKLPVATRNNYFVKEWLKEDELAWIYKNALGAISRSGANSVLEIAMMALPAIFIPLPFSYKNEQYLNAKWLVDEGGAIIIEQVDLNYSNLARSLGELEKHQLLMKNNLGKLKINRNADQKIYDLIMEVGGVER